MVIYDKIRENEINAPVAWLGVPVPPIFGYSLLSSHIVKIFVATRSKKLNFVDFGCMRMIR